MTSRGLALTLRRHIPVHIRNLATLNAMMREDERRFDQGVLLVDKDELMAIAQRKEGFLLEFEAEMRASGQMLDPRPTVDDIVHQTIPPRPAKVVGDRNGYRRDVRDNRDIRERLGPKQGDVPHGDTRECHICKKVGHLARNCSQTGAAPPPKPTSSGPDTLATHKTTGAVCEFCSKPGHVSAQCWSAHPELVPEGLIKKRQAAMASMRKRRKAPDYTSSGYTFQGMALPCDKSRSTLRTAMPPVPDILTPMAILTQAVEGLSLATSDSRRVTRECGGSTLGSSMQMFASLRHTTTPMDHVTPRLLAKAGGKTKDQDQEGVHYWEPILPEEPIVAVPAAEQVMTYTTPA